MVRIVGFVFGDAVPFGDFPGDERPGAPIVGEAVVQGMKADPV
jgi:hypothetical protein